MKCWPRFRPAILAADDPRMIAMQAYLAKERKGVPLNPGQH
jgi:hypothetical protein